MISCRILYVLQKYCSAIARVLKAAKKGLAKLWIRVRYECITASRTWVIFYPLSGPVTSDANF